MSRPRCLTLLAVVALVASGPIEAWAELDGARAVRRIEWRGVESVLRNELEDAILTTKASWKPWAERRPYDPDTLAQDLKRLRRFYRQKGFYDAQIRSEVAEAGDRAVVIRIFVDEGQRVPLEALNLSLKDSGKPASSLDADSLRQDLPLAQGGDFSPERYEQAKETLRLRLARLGYPAANLSGHAEVNLEQRAARVDWTLDPGPYVRFGEATPSGLDRVAPDLVLGEVLWKPGDPYDPDVLRRTERAIFALDVFRSVVIRPLPAKRVPGDGPVEEQWPLEIRVQERAPRALSAALGFGTEDRFRVKLGWKHRNFLGGLRSLRIGGKYSLLERGLEAVFVQPRFLHRDTRLTLDTVLSERTQPGFDTRGVSTGWLLERPLFGKWQGRMGQRFDLQRVTEVEADSPVIGLQEDESFQLLFFDVGLRRSSLDSAVDPQRGSWIDLSMEPSFEELGSDVSYVKVMAEARLFFSLTEKLVLATRARVGTLEPFGGDDAGDVPVFKRFFSGGSTSVRGFELNRLGPLDAQEDPLGGFTLAEASAELRLPIWRDLGGVLFVDAGQVALDSFELRGGDFFYSAGVGVRYKTPIGPLRLDFARILNPPTGIGGFRVHFSVGHAF